MASPATLFIGTAGWNVVRDQAARFPASGTHLARYAAVLNTAEINTSFYRPHRKATYERWAGSVPDDFRFAVKLPRTLTHDRRLAGGLDEMDRFVDEVSGLGPRLGVILVQLPPSLAFEAETADRFCEALTARTGAALALEPRHPTWFGAAADALLARHRIARVAADPAVVPEAGEPGGHGDLVYVRLHGSPRIYYSDYDPAALTAIGRRLRRYSEGARQTWCIFDNTAAFAALGNALVMADDMLPQPRAARSPQGR